ncbi:hypothetical protein H0V99_01180 [Candidatus Saccharibacteria bacterium]|nr:hypothetical protein [Candidatus Saccharibacteria bacterium]
MNDDQLNDLKQFIAVTVSQATADMATKSDIQLLKSDIKKLDVKIDDLDLKVDTISETLNDQHNQHEIRLTKLEQQTT